jgi:hypothetical protein
MFRQIVQGSTKLVRRSAISSKATLRFSSTFNERERFEETNYFRRQEEMQRQQARAELEKILSSTEHEQKKEVLEMLSKYLFFTNIFYVRKRNFNLPFSKTLQPRRKKRRLFGPS